MAQGQKYTQDRALDDTVAPLRTSVKEERLTRDGIENVVSQILYDGRWYQKNARQVKHIVTALISFQKAVIDGLIHLSGSELKDVYSILTAAYLQAGLEPILRDRGYVGER